MGQRIKWKIIMKLRLVISTFLALSMSIACQNAETANSKMSSDQVAESLGLVGTWLSPCIPFDGQSVKKIHKFSQGELLEVSVVEFKDTECNEQLKEVPIGNYKYSLSERESGFADINVSYPNHEEYGVVSTSGGQLRLVYGTDSKEMRNSVKLADLASLKAWYKLK